MKQRLDWVPFCMLASPVPLQDACFCPRYLVQAPGDWRRPVSLGLNLFYRKEQFPCSS
jgi:hypothetical protein